MTSLLREILPRQALRALDNRAGAYPTVQRAASRNGKFTIFFDDRDTPIFGATEVSAPTMLPLDSKNLDADLRSDITLFASSSKGVVESWLKTALQEQAIAPFREDGLFEQDLDKMSPGFLTGSGLTSVGLGFSSPLSAKTTLRFSFPISQQTRLDPTSASVYYYNFDQRKFDEKAPQLKSAPDFGSATAGDAKFFDYAGTYVLSGSGIEGIENDTVSEFDFNAHGDGLTVDPVPRFREKIALLLSYDEVNSGLRNAAYASTVSQSLSMDFLTEPFVLERMIVEIPFVAGPGWINDKTQIPAYTDFFDAVVDPYVPGGPCVTFALMNEIEGTHRELIASATIVPLKDVTEKASFNIFAATGSNFLDFSTPSCVVSGTNDFFTGTIRFEMTPASSCGISIIPSFDLSHYSVLSTTPTGRGKDGATSGRSPFGKEKIFPTRMAIDPQNDYRLSVPNLTARIDAHAYSPYLLHPSDRIVFSVSKFRSAFKSGDFGPVLSGSHDVAIGSGTMKISLFGSHVRAGSEVLPTSNEPLTTLAIHETLGDDASDEWQVERPFSYVGSWTDNIITGSLTNVFTNGRSFEPARGVIGSRALASSSIDTATLFSVRYGVNSYQIAGTNLSTQVVSTNERFWDTLLPNISDIINRDKAIIYVSSGSVAAGVGTIYFDINLDGSGSGNYIHGENNFSKSYPFEPHYAGLIRRSSQGDSVVSNKFIAADFGLTDFSTPLSRFLLFTVFNDTILLMVDATSDTNFLFPRPSDDAFTKFIFGFGDKNNYIFTSKGDEFIGSTKTVEYGILLDGLGVGPQIRGWKYGILNGLATFSRCHYRRDSYGQLRDMLEQRQDTTFYETVGYKSDGSKGGVIGKLPSPILVRFVNSSGSIVSPELTMSQNLSYEATSSLPYFDGRALGR